MKSQSTSVRTFPTPMYAGDLGRFQEFHVNVPVLSEITFGSLSAGLSSFYV